jgi:hypothetical protein
MSIDIKPSALRETKWYEFAVRFVFGGLVTVLAGIIAKRSGPVVGGLFLAFPAIFPASATLIEKHERQRKEKHGLRGERRGREAASVDAAGAALGSLGLIAFGGMIWGLAPLFSAPVVLVAALLVWCGVSVLAWNIRKKLRISVARKAQS